MIGTLFVRTRRETIRGTMALGAAILAIVAVTIVAYSPALDGDFLFDDKTSIESNSRVQSWAGYSSGWDLEYAFAQRPFTDLTFALDAARSSLQPRAFHETSIVLHLVATLLVFAFTRIVFLRSGASTRATWSAVVVAALFATHPIQTEAVAYSSQRAELLASLLAVASLLLLLLAEGARRPAHARWLGGAASGVFVLAAASKIVAAVVPALFLLAVTFLPASEGESAGSNAPGATRGRWLRRAGLLAPLVVVATIQAVVFFHAVKGSRDVGFSVPGLDSGRYLLTQARVIPRYMQLVAFPVGQNVDHEIAPSTNLTEPPSTIAGGGFLLLLMAGSTLGLVWTRGRGRDAACAPALRIASFGVVWFLALLAPTSSLVPLADVAAEHRVYLASWGLLAASVALAGHALLRLPSRARAALAVSLAILPTLALAVALHSRATLWGDPIALWRDAAEKSPGRSRPHANIGDELFERGDLDGAIASYGRVLTLDSAATHEPVLRRIASAHLQRRRPAEAQTLLMGVKDPEPETVALLALAEIELGDLARAESHAWELVVRARPFARSHDVMGRVLEAKGDLAGARESFRRAAALAPGAETLRQLGRIELRLGNRPAACGALARAGASLDNRWMARWAAADARQAGCR